MDTRNSRPVQGRSDDSSKESGDWRAQMAADSRLRTVSKVMDSLERHLPFYGDAGLHELKKIAERFEEKIYAAATSQSDYLRKISLKMLSMDTRSQNPMPDGYVQSNSIANSVNFSCPDGIAVDGSQGVNPYKRDPLCEIVGPMTRARIKRRLDALSVGAKPKT